MAEATGVEGHELVSLDFRCGSRLCENYFSATETKYLFVKLASAATMIRPRYLPDSIVARKVSASAFLHSLGQKRKSSVDHGMSALGGVASTDRYNTRVESFCVLRKY